jgi:hypothetical protein
MPTGVPMTHVVDEAALDECAAELAEAPWGVCR